MKSSSKLACLFGLWLLNGLCMLASVSAASDKWVTITVSNLDTANRARLVKLYLLPDVGADESKAAYMAPWRYEEEDILDIYNGLFVDKEVVKSNDQSRLVVVWWWEWNRISWWLENNPRKYSGIAWWQNNKIEANNAAIWGGGYNNVSLEGGVIAWWTGNKVTWTTGNWWVVIWWKSNTSLNWWVVIWWQNNKIGKDGLAMWVWAKWWEWSFVWNDGSIVDEAGDNSALIWASNWVLIGTNELAPKPGVSLVVDWAIQIWNNASEDPLAWEIRSQNGCFYSFDGTSWHALGKTSQGSCKEMSKMAVTCEFGRTLLQEWDVVTAYSSTYASTCDSRSVHCVNEWWHWVLKEVDGTSTAYKYATCYTMSSAPYYW